MRGERSENVWERRKKRLVSKYLIFQHLIFYLLYVIQKYFYLLIFLYSLIIVNLRPHKKWGHVLLLHSLHMKRTDPDRNDANEKRKGGNGTVEIFRFFNFSIKKDTWGALVHSIDHTDRICPKSSMTFCR